MIAFVVALPCEAEGVISLIENRHEEIISGKRVVSGKLCKREVVLAISGIGKVNAALTAQAVIDRFSPKLIFNFGTAGGANDNVTVFSYYLINKCCQYDFDITAIDDVPVGYIQDYGCVFFNAQDCGIDFLEERALASADRFSNAPSDIKTVNDANCGLRDMEGGAIGEVCAANRVPFVMIKGVTDIYNKPATEYAQNNKKVCDGFAEIIKSALAKIKND